jgi:type I pantothenate kinase
VAVGKSTLAASLAERLAPLRVAVVATDGFLLPNDELSARGLLARKGFPESYDADAMAAFVGELRAGRPASVPVYSHATYDRLPGEVTVVEAGEVDVVIVEGVNALQPELASGADLAVYLDADEPLVRSWYVERFVEQIVLAESDETSFYRGFTSLDAAGRRAMAESVWEAVNLVNLVDHIEPTRARAHLVLVKGEGHRLR